MKILNHNFLIGSTRDSARSDSVSSGQVVLPAMFTGLVAALLFLAISAVVVSGEAQAGSSSGSQVHMDRDFDANGSGDSSVAATPGSGFGSLPIIQTDDPEEEVGNMIPIRFLGAFGLPRPYLLLSGDLDEIYKAILRLNGSGVVTIIPQLDGSFDVGLHGDIRVDLDPDQLRGSGVELGVQLSPEFNGGVTQSCWNGICSGFLGLPVTSAMNALDLPYEVLLHSGMLEEATYELLYVGIVGTISNLKIDSVEGSLQISQSHKL